jgi:hypothetical protein
MDGFTPGDLGLVIGEMIGGPLDGKKYGDLPLMPDGLPPDRIDIPLAAPSRSGPRVVYRRADVVPAAGGWRYLWTPGPADAASLIAATAVAGQHAPA